jgi:hypothetical protein
VARAVGHNADLVVAKLANPVVIAADNVARLVEQKMVGEDTVDCCRRREQRALDSAGVVYAGLNLVALILYSVALDRNLIALRGNFLLLLGQFGGGIGFPRIPKL